jgi:Ca2+-binding EF-hand superfamily protein
MNTHMAMSTMTSNFLQNFKFPFSLRCFLRQFDCYSAISEETTSDVWGTQQQQLSDDLSRLIKRYDRDVNGSWSFREFLTFVQPLTQYSLKAKDLSTALEVNLGGPEMGGGPANDMDSVSISSSIGELNQMLKKKKGKENKSMGFSKATRSTAAMSGHESFHRGQNQMSTIQYGGGAGGAGARDESSIYNMRGVESALGGKSQSRDVLNFPYMCDESVNNEEMQFADKIKMMNSMKGSGVPKNNKPIVIQAASGDPLTTILIQTFVDMMQVEGDLEKKRRELGMRQDFNITDLYKLFNSVKQNKRGFDVDDLYYVLKEHLQLPHLTKDEIFILFYKMDRDGDGFVTYGDMGRSFVPRAQHEYKVLVESRGAYHGDHTQPRDFFSPETRELLRKTVRGIIDCEVSIELIKQRLLNHK